MLQDLRFLASEICNFLNTYDFLTVKQIREGTMLAQLHVYTLSALRKGVGYNLPNGVGRCYRYVLEILVLRHDGYLTVFSFTVLRPVVMKLLTQSEAPARIRTHDL